MPTQYKRKAGVMRKLWSQEKSSTEESCSDWENDMKKTATKKKIQRKDAKYFFFH